MINAIVIILGLSLDGFVSMMQVGATVRELTWKKRTIYALVYAGAAMVLALVGFGFANIAKNYLLEHYEFSIASLIIFSLGIILMTKSYKGSQFEERLDKTFNIRKLVRLSVMTNIDAMALAAGFSFLGYSLTLVVPAMMIFGFLFAWTALTVGYNLGASYQRQIGFCAGALMVVFSVWILIRYVLMGL